MALSIYTGDRTFIENPSRVVSQKFGSVTTLTTVWTGRELDYDRWVPKPGTPHPDYRWMFFVGDSRKDLGGGALEATLSYAGNPALSQVSASGIPYTDLKVNVELAAKSYSWSGVMFVPETGGGSALAKVEFSVLYSTLEVSFSYTAYQYPNGGLFGSLAPGFCKMVNAYPVFAFSAPPAGTSYTGVPTLPSTVRPLNVVTKFSCKQASPSTQTQTGEPWDATLTSTAGIWDVSETWGLEFNLSSLGIASPSYVETTPE